MSRERFGAMADSTSSTDSQDDSMTKAMTSAGFFINVLGLYSRTSAIASLAVIALSSLLVLFHSVRQRSLRSRSNNNNHQSCPNPNCVRCRRYSEVNASAKRRLPWVLGDLKQNKGNVGLVVEHELDRVCHAVRQGPDGVSSASGQYPTVLLVRDLTAQPLVTLLHPYVEKVFGHDETLRQRLLSEYIAAQTDQDTWLENDVQEGEWKVLHLLNQGVWQERNCKNCPSIVSTIERLQPHVVDKCLFGNAFVSVLQPGTVIQPHCGPTNVRHRLHYALQVPNDDEPKLTVMDTQQTWTEGQCFLFDDSFTHSVAYPARKLTTNQCSGKMCARVVLIVDLWHPRLSQLEREVITELYPSESALRKIE